MSHIDVLMGGIFWEGEVDYVSVAYNGSEGGRPYILEGWVDNGRVTHLTGGGIFSERGVDFGKAG